MAKFLKNARRTKITKLNEHNRRSKRTKCLIKMQSTNMNND